MTGRRHLVERAAQRQRLRLRQRQHGAQRLYALVEGGLDLDAPRARVGQVDLGAQHVEPGDRAGLEARPGQLELAGASAMPSSATRMLCSFVSARKEGLDHAQVQLLARARELERRPGQRRALQAAAAGEPAAGVERLRHLELT